MRAYVLRITSALSYSLAAEAGAFAVVGADIVLKVVEADLGTITDLTATPLVESMRLDWTPAANATSHQPQYSDDSETWSNFGSALGGSASTVTITGLTADVEYSGRVVASDGSTQTISNADTATPGAATSGVIFEDDFSTDKSASYFEADGMVRTAEAGPDGGYAMVATVTQSQTNGGSLKLAFGRTPDAYIAPADAGVQDYREVYYAFDFKASSGFQSQDGMKVTRATIFAQANWAQAMIGHVWTGNGSANTRLVADPASGTSTGGTLQTTTYNDFENLRWLGAEGGSTAITDGDWHNIETRVRLNDAGQSNGVFQVWIDGALDIDISGLNWVGAYDAYGINAILLESYYNSGAGQAQSVAFANFVVSTERIGSDAPAALDAGEISVTAGDEEYTVAQLVAPSGGSGSYSRQVYESTTSGQLGSAVSGATSLPYQRTERTNDQTYYVTLRVSDGADTADTPQVSVTPEAASGGSPDFVEDFSTYTSTANMLSNPRGIYQTFEDFRPDQMTLDTTVGYGSSGQSMRYDYPSGTGTDYTISRSIDIDNQTEVWIEAAIRWSSNFTIAGNGQSAGSALKTMHVGISGAAGRFGLNLEGSSMRAEGPNDNYDNFYINAGPSVSTLFDGEWHILRYHVRLGASDFHEYWVDGTYRGSATSTTSASALRTIALCRNLNKQPPQAMSLWWGRVALWLSDPGWS